MAASTETLRLQNLQQVRRALMAHPGSTKADIARHSGLSQATCNTLLNQLAATGEALSIPLPSGGSGRPASVYHYNENYGQFLCFSIDVVTMHATLTTYNLLLQPLARQSYPKSDFAPDALVPWLAAQAAALPNLLVASVAVPGIVINGNVEFCDIPALQGVALGPLLEKALGLPVCIENNVNAAVLGFQAAKGLPSNTTIGWLYYPKGFCPGAGLLVDGNILRGADGFAGEIGWLPLKNATHCPPLQQAAFALASLVALVNPHTVLFSGNLLSSSMLPQIKQLCAQSIPPQYIPKTQYIQDFTPYMQQGLATLANCVLQKLQLTV